MESLYGKTTSPHSYKYTKKGVISGVFLWIYLYEYVFSLLYFRSQMFYNTGKFRYIDRKQLDLLVLKLPNLNLVALRKKIPVMVFSILRNFEKFLLHWTLRTTASDFR